MALAGVGRSGNTGGVQGQEFIDVKTMVRDRTVEDFVAAAEAHFREIDAEARNYLLAKPLVHDSAPHYFTRLAHLLHGLRLEPELKVLDFGAGSCWTTRFLTQLGTEAIALDVSPSALALGKELFQRHPILGEHIEPTFLPYDGRHIQLPDGAVDRIFCHDTFHHVPNPGETLAEMARVLRRGGWAGFVEPGPEHSRSRESQDEMRRHRIVENDIVIREIWDLAQGAGFTNIKLTIFDPGLYAVSLDEFEAFLEEGGPVTDYLAHLRGGLRYERLFFLYKGEPRPPRSYTAEGLGMQLRVDLPEHRFRQGETIRGTARIRNTGTVEWLPAGRRIGGVLLCGRITDADQRLRAELSWPVSQDSVPPGAEVETTFEIPASETGRFHIEFDLDAAHVSRFSVMGSEPAGVDLEVRP